MRYLLCSLLLAGMLAASAAGAVDSRPPDRLSLSVNGATLTSTNGGEGGAIQWLHPFSADTVVGLGAEHQHIADSRWTFGSLSASHAWGSADKRSSIFAETHQGTGDDNGSSFTYSVSVAGLSQGFTQSFSVQLEDRQIDIETSHGNLPKLSLSYLWARRVLTSLGYTRSVSGNLGTELGTLRIDGYSPQLNWLLGGAGGRASPAVVNLQTGEVLPGNTLREGFAGIGKTLGRADWLLLGDYLKLGDSERVTVTLSCSLQLGPNPSR